MRITLALVVSIIIAVGLVAFGFTYFQISSEKTRLLSDIEIRTAQISDEILKNDPWFHRKANHRNIEYKADSLRVLYNLRGIAFYYSFKLAAEAIKNFYLVALFQAHNLF